MATDGDEREQRLRAAQAELTVAREDDDDARLARALIGRARALRAVGRDDDALVDLLEVVDRIPPSEDLELRELLAWATHLKLRWSRVGDAETLERARELFALCTGQPSLGLERRAALALGMQADAQRRLGDLRAAIATRRWLITEFGDMRPRGRPDLVFDHRFMLARDLYESGRWAESAQTCAELIVALGSADASNSPRRIADALRWQMHALWKRGESARSRAVFDELQQRFARADDPATRHVAAMALAAMAQQRLYERDIPEAVALADALLARFLDEGDATLRTPVAAELESVADALATGFGPRRLMVTASLVAPVRGRRRPAALLRRRRLAPVAGMLAQVDCADRLTTVLHAAFRDDDSAPGRAVYGRTVLDGAVIAVRRGRLLTGVRGCEAFYSLDPSTISAVVTSAVAVGEDRYRLTDWMAALLATTVPPDPARAAETRAAIRTLLRSQTHTPVSRRYLEHSLRGLDRAGR